MGNCDLQDALQYWPARPLSLMPELLEEVMAPVPIFTVEAI
jgi:hypothetical protein